MGSNVMKIEKILKKLFKRKGYFRSSRDINYETAKRIIRTDNLAVLVDVRSPQEFRENRLSNAINLPLYDIEKLATQVLPDNDVAVILYCQCGTRRKQALRKLENMGYTNLYNLDGGINML